MDQLNAQQLHGISPALDLLAVSESCPSLSPVRSSPDDAPLSILQLAPYDARHTVYTIGRCERHAQFRSGPIHLYVYEEEPENLARHILLLSVLLDGSLLPKERMEIFLELHSNAMLRERTANYLDQRGQQLEAMLVTLSSKGELPTAGNSSKAAVSNASSYGNSGIPLLASLLDISLLKFQDRDRLVEVFKSYRKSVPFDMVKAWDTRSRKWYGDRFDFRRNMIDWDYHMPLLQAGTPGVDSAAGSIIHFHHFRFWRMTGIAFELRDSQYNEPNRSLVTSAVGRTKDFKDRNGKDVGRSVSAWGYWGDILNSPYHCFGTVSEDPSLFKVTNKQFGRTAVDVAEHNILSLLQEMRTGRASEPSSSGEAHRARVAHGGPISMADLEEDSSRRQQAEAACKEHEEQAAGKRQLQPDSANQNNLESEVQGKLQLGLSVQQQQQQQQQQQGEDAADSQGQEQQGQVCARGSGSSTGDNKANFVPCATFQGPKPGYSFKNGGQGLGYYADFTQQQRPGGGCQRVSQQDARAGSEDGTQVGGCGQGPQQQREGVDAARQAGIDPAPAAQSQEMAKEEEAIRRAEAQLDAAAAEKLGGGQFKLVPVLGTPVGVGGGPVDFGKLLSGKCKFAGRFGLVTVGHRHVHMLGQDYGISMLLVPGGLVVAESGKCMLQLNREQGKAFAGKVDELAATSGFSRAEVLEKQLQRPQPGSCTGMSLPDAYLLYSKPL